MPTAFLMQQMQWREALDEAASAADLDALEDETQAARSATLARCGELIDALARYGRARPSMVEPLEIAPNLWPSSGVIDWISVLTRMKDLPHREERLAEARQILKSRLNFSGTTMMACLMP